MLPSWLGAPAGDIRWNWPLGYVEVQQRNWERILQAKGEEQTKPQRYKPAISEVEGLPKHIM